MFRYIRKECTHKASVIMGLPIFNFIWLGPLPYANIAEESLEFSYCTSDCLFFFVFSFPLFNAAGAAQQGRKALH